MWRGLGQGRSGGTAGRKVDPSGVPQVVAVAINGGKSSQHALKWAADHVISRGQIFFLVHVRKKITSIPTPTGQQISITDVQDEVAAAFLEQLDLQTKELLLPFQCFCSRRGLQCKEIILDDSDVSKTVVDFIMHQNVDKLVLGASSRNALMRTFKSADVATSVSKLAPDFCSVYIISKGKISSVKPATRPNKHNVPKPVLGLEADANHFQSIKSEPDIARNHIASPGRYPLARASRFRPAEPSGFSNDSFEETEGNGDRLLQSGGYHDFSYQSVASCPSPSRSIYERSMNPLKREFADSGLRRSRLSNLGNERTAQKGSAQQKMYGSSYESNYSGTSSYERSLPLPDEHSASSWSQNSLDETDAELERLKLELKQKTDILEENYEMQYEMDRDQMSWGAETKSTIKEIDHRPEMPFEAAQIIGKKELDASRKRNEEHLPQELKEELRFDDLGIRYRRYTHEEICKATNNFSDELKIGEGGYGPVYKSTIDHTLVAIKILRSDATQGMKQFKQEVEVLSCIRHPNMVLLMGACPESGCLVYEYMANGSLEDRLLCQSGTAPLSWQLRFKIAAEVASGLLFLHQTKPEPLVHRDLKPGNILLDHNFVGKIADVGLARLIPPSVVDSNATQLHMTAAAGTFCYIDPEYQKTGMVSVKSDIYALGIILLQMITARPPMGLAHNVENAIEEGNFEEMLDPNVPDWPLEETLTLAKLALQCAELRRRDRPDLASVLLPELNRLRALAASTEVETPRMHHQVRSLSHKDIMRNRGMEIPQFFDGVKGQSFYS